MKNEQYRPSNKDVGDSLRLEVDLFTPSQSERVRSFFGSYADILESEFAIYFPQGARERGRDALYNLIGVNSPTHFTQAWGQFEGTSSRYREIMEQENTSTYGIYTCLEGIPLVTIADYDEFRRKANNLANSSVENGFHSTQSDTKARDIFNALLFGYAVLHEVGHAYQDPKLPRAYKEISADFIADSVLAKSHNGLTISKKETDFFRELVAKYGENVYRTIFGTCRNPITRYRILRELNWEKYVQVSPERAAQDQRDNNLGIVRV